MRQPKFPGLLFVGAVDVGAVEPVRQCVDLLHGAGAAVESGGAVGAHKVHAGLPEEGVVARYPDGEALRLRALESRVLEIAALATVTLDRCGVADVVIHKLAKRHHEHREASPRDIRIPGESI